MKFRKQTGLKASILAVAGGLFLAFLGLIRANPGISADASVSEPAPTPTPAVDPYRGFFGGQRQQPRTDPQVLPPTNSTTTTQRPTHTRSHAS